MFIMQANQRGRLLGGSLPGEALFAAVLPICADAALCRRRPLRLCRAHVAVSFDVPPNPTFSCRASTPTGC